MLLRQYSCRGIHNLQQPIGRRRIHHVAVTPVSEESGCQNDYKNGRITGRQEHITHVLRHLH